MTSKARLAVFSMAGAAILAVCVTTPAQAASTSVTQNCGSSGSVDVALTVGDTYTIVNGGGCTLAAAFRGPGETRIDSTPLVAGYGNQVFSSGASLIYSATAAGSKQVQVGGTWVVLYTFTVTGGLSASSGTDEPPAVPADLVQQVEPSAAGCSAVQRPDLNWSGVDSGGWGSSWAQWANGGRGGEVCTRTLTFAASGWRVSAL